jgi:hypothetical protein
MGVLAGLDLSARLVPVGMTKNSEVPAAMRLPAHVHGGRALLSVFDRLV